MEISPKAKEIAGSLLTNRLFSNSLFSTAAVHVFAVFLLALTTVAVYLPVVRFPFFFDDFPVIVENDALLSQLDFFTSLKGSPSRTFTNWTFALNAVDGVTAPSFHLVNAAIHVVNTVLLYGVLCLLVPRIYPSTNLLGSLPFFSALIWSLHPLNSQPVVYVVQRSELLATSFLFLSMILYLLANSRFGCLNWFLQLSTAISLGLGLISKESAITFPIILVLMDWAFLSRSVGDMIRKNWLLEAIGITGCVMFLWLMLPVILGNAEGTAGLRMERITWDQYLLTQPEVILRYLSLLVYPQGQSIDYGWPPQAQVWQSVCSFLILSTTVILLLGLNRFSRLAAFFVTSYFLLLLPTCSFVPLADIAVEHRAYAANSMLIAYLCFVLLELFKAFRLSIVTSSLVLGCIGVILSFSTANRIQVFSDPVTLWRDVIDKSEGRTNIHLLRAWNNLSEGLAQQELWKESLAAGEAALKLAPNNMTFSGNVARAHMALGNYQAAYATLKPCLESNPESNDAKFHNLIGLVCIRLRNFDEAIKWMTLAHQESPETVGYSLNLAQLLLDTGKPDLGLKIIDEILLKKPAGPEAYLKKARYLISSKQSEGAFELLEEVSERFPDNAEAHYLLGLVFIDRNSTQDAYEQFKAAVERNPKEGRFWMFLGRASRAVGDLETAKKAYEQAVRIDSKKPEAWINIGAISVAQSPDYATLCFRKALELDPTNHMARFNLAMMLKGSRKIDEARGHLEQIVKEDPKNENALKELQSLPPPKVE